jgi:two-component system sensor histidine kinase/response regulator
MMRSRIYSKGPSCDSNATGRVQLEAEAPHDDCGEQAVVNEGTQSSIMVVDDQPANLKLMETMLRQQGYEVRSFPRGRMALAAAGQQAPDLILLDITMPEMNGYEVCERLKSDDKLAQIPVIFLSALSETEDKVRALRCGGVDYISKPFQFEEVKARVETHLELYSLQRALQFQNERLEQAVATRTGELAEANQRLRILDSSKNEFLSLISHEFRTPLNGLLGVGELVLNELAASPDTDELREMFEQSRQRILSILDDAMLLTQIDVERERFPPGRVELSVALKRAVGLATELAQSRQVRLDPASCGKAIVVGEEELLVKALHALIETGVKFSEQSASVRITCSADSDPIVVTIDSYGKAIPMHQIPKFFDLFSVSEASTPGGDLGLGPPVACRILALFDGAVTVANRDSSGIRLTVSLKSSNPQAPRCAQSP